MTDTITRALLEKLRDHESADCVGDGGCYVGSVAGDAADKIEQYEQIINERIGAEHYGPYGTACQNTGQFDAGECWICYAKRKKAVAASKERQIDDLVARAQILQADTKKYKKARYDTLEQHERLSEEWKASREVLIRERGEMQLVAGRYQFQFEQAMKCINSIDDLFEYAYKGIGRTKLREMVRNYLAVFTAAVKPKGK